MEIKINAADHVSVSSGPTRLGLGRCVQSYIPASAKSAPDASMSRAQIRVGSKRLVSSRYKNPGLILGPTYSEKNNKTDCHKSGLFISSHLIFAATKECSATDPGL